MRPHLRHAAALTLLALAAPGARAQEPDAARAAEARGDFAAAERAWAAVAEAQPELMAAVLGQARCLSRLGRFDDALDLLEGAMPRFAARADVHTAVATTYHLKAEDMVARGIRDANVVFQFEEAARIAEASLARFPDQRDLYLVLAQAHYQLGDLDAAQAAAEQAAARFPDHPGGHILRGKIAYQRFVALKQEYAAEKPAGDALRQLLDDTKAQRDLATEAFTAAVRADPSRSLPHVQLGDIEAWVGNIEQALVHYQAALSIDANAAVDHRWVTSRASPQRCVQLYEAAAKAYRAREAATPAAAAALDWWHAYSLLLAKDHEPAYVLFTRAVAANENYQNSHCYAMQAAFWANNHDNAELQAAEYARAAPRHFADHIRNFTDSEETVGIVKYLADRAFGAGRLARGRDLNHVLAMVADTADAWNNYAFLCRETQDYTASFDAYTNALTLEPDSPQLLNDAAVILHYHLGSDDNYRKARAYYERAVAAADAILAGGEADPDALERARTARRDARSNLKALGDKGR